jgi:hypothetical protein
MNQLGNRVQHNLHAYTPEELKTVKAAAQSFRENPNIDTEKAITELKTGEALISFQTDEGEPEIVERCNVLPPESYIGTITNEERTNLESTEKRFEKEFPTDMTFVNYNLNLKDFQNLSSLNFLGMNSNLKFEKNFQPEMLTLIIDDQLLENINLVKDIADLISNCPNLIIVNYI